MLNKASAVRLKKRLVIGSRGTAGNFWIQGGVLINALDITSCLSVTLVKKNTVELRLLFPHVPMCFWSTDSS